MMDFEFFGFGKKQQKEETPTSLPKTKNSGKSSPKKNSAAEKQAEKNMKKESAPPSPKQKAGKKSGQSNTNPPGPPPKETPKRASQVTQGSAKSKQTDKSKTSQNKKQTPQPTPKQATKQTPKKGKKGEEYTTVMLRNIPNKYTREMLAGELDAQGFSGKYVFLFLPTDFVNGANPGYCFVDFRTNDARRDFESKFHNKSVQDVLPAFKSHKVCEVSKAKHQGLEANLENLRSSDDLMRRLATRPQCTPLVYDEDGNEMKFETPAPRPEDEPTVGKRSRNKSSGRSTSPSTGKGGSRNKRQSAMTRTTSATAGMTTAKSSKYSNESKMSGKKNLKNSQNQNEQWNYAKNANWYYGNYATQQDLDKSAAGQMQGKKAGKGGKGIPKGAPNVQGKKVRTLSLSAGMPPHPMYPMKLEQAYMCAYRDWMASTMASYMNSPTAGNSWGSSPWANPPPAPGLSSWLY